MPRIFLEKEPPKREKRMLMFILPWILFLLSIVFILGYYIKEKGLLKNILPSQEEKIGEKKEAFLEKELPWEKWEEEKKKEHKESLPEDPLLEQAIALYEEGKWASSKSLLRRILQEGKPSSFSWAYFYLGKIAEKEGDLLLAEEYYKKAIEKEEKAPFFYALSKLYLQKGEIDRSLSILKYLREKFPQFSLGTLLEGILYYKRGFYQKAEKLLEEYIEEEKDPIGY